MHEKNSINFLSYIPVCFLLLSCSTALDGVYTWDSFIKERSYDGDTFFAEAKLQMVLFHMVVLMIVKEQLTIWLQDIALKILVKYVK